MAIEFRCPNCKKKLRTADDRAGRAAKCPQCGTAVQVPSPEFGEDFAEEDFGLPVGPVGAGGTIPCPMCGAAADPAAGKCYACGEDLTTHPRWEGGAVRRTVDLGEAFSGGWALFRDRLWGLIVILLGTGLVSSLASIPVYLAGVGIVVALSGGPAAMQNQEPDFLLLGVVYFAVIFIAQFIGWFFMVGGARAALTLVRTGQLEPGLIFSGARYYKLMVLNGLATSLVMQLPSIVAEGLKLAGANDGAGAVSGLQAAGLLLSLVAMVVNVVVLCCIWPYLLVIVDERSPAMTGLDPLRHAWALTKGSRLISFVLFLALGILQYAGLCMLCIGVVFTAAYAMATMLAAYEQISPKLRGMRPADGHAVS